jgi:hypothetical protein
MGGKAVSAAGLEAKAKQAQAAIDELMTGDPETDRKLMRTTGVSFMLLRVAIYELGASITKELERIRRRPPGAP